MLYPTPTLDLLARAIDVSALRQSTYAANVANAGVDGYRRLEVSFDRELERVGLELASAHAPTHAAAPMTASSATVVPTDASVRLDEEVGLMARNALHYQILLDAFARSMGSLRMAIREGRE